MRRVTALFALAPALLLAQTSPERTLVIVNGEPIKGATYLKRMEVLPGVGQLVDDQFIPATPGFLTLSRLMNETLMLQLAKEKGVYPTDAEVEREQQRRLSENPDFLKAFQTLGFTAEDFRYDTLVQLTEFKVATMGVNITDLEIEKYYKDNPTSFAFPKRYRLRVVAVKGTADKDKVDAALKAGRPFGEVAREFSTDVTKGSDGLIGDVPEDKLGDPFDKTIKGQSKGYVSEWIEREGTSLKMWLEDVLPAETVALDANVRQKIRRDLMLARGQVRNNVGEMMAEFRRRARIEYQGTPFDAQLKQMFGG